MSSSLPIDYPLSSPYAHTTLILIFIVIYMAGIILGTASILSSTSTLIASLRHLTSRLKSFSAPCSVEIREKDRRRLLALQRRIDALSEPLAFALVTARSLASRDFVVYARRLVADVKLFLDSQLRFEFIDDAKALTAASAESLDFYLTELSFVLSGLNNFFSPVVTETVGSSVSPSALLQASHRVSDHRQLTGDVLTVALCDIVKLRVVRKADQKFHVYIGDHPEFSLSLSHNVRIQQGMLLWDVQTPIISGGSNQQSGSDEEDTFVMVDEEGRTRRSSYVTRTETREVEFLLNDMNEWSAESVIYLLRLCAFENDTEQTHVGMADDTIRKLLVEN
jgi:hypothetical protein